MRDKQLEAELGMRGCRIWILQLNIILFLLVMIQIAIYKISYITHSGDLAFFYVLGSVVLIWLTPGINFFRSFPPGPFILAYPAELHIAISMLNDYKVKLSKLRNGV